MQAAARELRVVDTPLSRGHSRTPSADARAVARQLRAERLAVQEEVSHAGVSLHTRVPSADVRTVMALLRQEMRGEPSAAAADPSAPAAATGARSV
eukprot:2624353-Prymnesium_polylepis.1